MTTSSFDITDASCRRCDYPLKGLPQSRCPECGCAFDPRNATTVRLPHVPRVVQVLLDTSRWRTDRARWFALVVIAWGLMLFPGGYFAVIAGVAAAVVAFPLRGAWSLCCVGLARAFGTTFVPERRSFLPWAALLLLVTTGSMGWVTRLSLALHAPLLNAYAYRVHEQEPFIGQTLVKPRMIGLLTVHDIDNSPSGLSLYVGPGCALHYDPAGRWETPGVLGPRWYIVLPWIGGRRSYC